MSDYSRRNNEQTSSGGTNSSTAANDLFDQAMGNEEQQKLMKVSGNLGRAFNRIAGVSEGNTDPSGLAFSRDDLKRYLEDSLKLAEGEWFRSAKISGVADEIMETLDAGKDGTVDWAEFQTMVDELTTHMVGELGPGAGSAEIQAKASELFAGISGGQDSVGFEKLESETKSELPEDMEHKDLVAQLAALLVIDVVDIDEASKDVRDRSISRAEWMGAVTSFTE